MTTTQCHAQLGTTPERGLGLTLIALPLVKLAIQLLAAGCYSYFRDELYYLACSHRLACGYVDHPPFSIAALRVWTTIFGESVVAIRALAALAGATTVLVTDLTARALGGGASVGLGAGPYARRSENAGYVA